MKQWIALCVAALMAASFSAFAQNNNEVLEQARQQVQEKQDALDNAERAHREQKAEARRNIDAAQRQIDSNKESVDLGKRRLQVLKEDLKARENELKIKKEALKLEKKALKLDAYDTPDSIFSLLYLIAQSHVALAVVHLVGVKSNGILTARGTQV